MAKIIVEEINRFGHVAHFHQFDSLPIYIGRDYKNDVIISDPYVSPKHVMIHANDQGWDVEDLNSMNGVIIKNKLGRERKNFIRPGDEITIGRSRLRFFSPEYAVDKTRPMSHSRNLFKQLSHPLSTILIIILCLAFFISEEKLETTQQLTVLKTAINIFPFFSVAIIWAGLWALVGRVSRHQSLFLTHLIIILVFSVISKGLSNLGDYLSFNLFLEPYFSSYYFLTIGILLAWMLSINLYYGTNLSRRARLVSSSMAGIFLIVLISLNKVNYEGEFQSYPNYAPTLKPPFAKFTKDNTVDAFMEKSKVIFDIDIKKESPDESGQ